MKRLQQKIINQKWGLPLHQFCRYVDKLRMISASRFVRLLKVLRLDIKAKALGKIGAGFTVVEIVVAVVVLGIMIIAVTNLVIGVGTIQRQNQHLTLAGRTAEAKIESLRNNHYNNLVNSPPAIDFTSELPDSLPSPRSAQVTVSEPSPGLKQLDIVITYREGSRNKTVEMSALIGNIGISQ